MIIDLKDATIKLKDAGSNEIELHIGSGNLSYTENRQIKYVTDKGLLWKTKLGDEQPMDVSLDIVWEYLRSKTSGMVSVTPYYTLSGFSEHVTYPGVDWNGVYTKVGTHNGFDYYQKSGVGYLYYSSVDEVWFLNVNSPGVGVPAWASEFIYTYFSESTVWVPYVGGSGIAGSGERTTEELEEVTPTPYEVLKRIGNASSWVSTETDSCQPFAVDLEIFFDRPCGRTEKIVLPKFRYETIGGDLGEGTLAVSGKANAKEPLVTVS